MSDASHKSLQAGEVRPLIYLAPMSGVTDAPFREAVRAFGVGTLVSEMVASIAMIETMRDSRKLRHVFDPDAPTVLQLAGYDADLIGQAVAIACDRGAQAIDLNFGCPARKVVGKAAGSALMREPELCLEIFKAVGKAAKVPWSVKMRLGWDWDCLNAAELAQAAVGEGAQLITVHGRTRCEFYKGQADWRAVGQAISGLQATTLVNGDIETAEQARQALDQSGADGVMLGRATTGRPWHLRSLALGLAGQDWTPAWASQVAAHQGLLNHMLSFHGSAVGLKSYRKHLAAWLPASDLRATLLKSEDPEAVLTGLESLAPPVQQAA